MILFRTLIPLMFLAVPAAAQTPAEAAFQTNVAACHDGGGGECVGRAALNLCRAEHGDIVTDHDNADCADYENQWWDARLNAAYQALLKRPDGEALRAPQRAWLAERDAECARVFDEAGGGTLAVWAQANCILQSTAARTLELEVMLTGAGQ